MPKDSLSSKVIAGQRSWVMRSSTVELALTENGGHLAPVTFDRTGHRFEPYQVAPWHSEKLPADTPAILRILRGDFFCLPFGVTSAPVKGTKLPIHGASANDPWELQSYAENGPVKILHVAQEQKALGGWIDKKIHLVDGHNAVYSRHVLNGLSGKFNPGHHATLKFPDKPGSALISVSPFRFGQVCPAQFEQPENRGYTSLRHGSFFKSLSKVELAAGGHTDLSSYPARRGYEDIVMLASDQRLPFAWTAAVVPDAGYVWIGFKDPRVLRQTIFWISNGGRHYSPWNGRHVNVMGLEEVTSHFGDGMNVSARTNAFTRKGSSTCLAVSPRRPTVINYIMACAPLPRGAGKVTSVSATQGRALVRFAGGKSVTLDVDLNFLFQDQAS